MSDTQLAPGIFHQLVRNVTEDVLAVNVGSGSVRVLATPMIVAFMEEAASACVAGRRLSV